MTRGAAVPAQVLVVCVLAVAGAGCAEPVEGNSACPSDDSKLDLRAQLGIADATGKAAASHYKDDVSSYAPGFIREFAFVMRNDASPTGARPLKVLAVTLTETTADGKPAATPHFACSGPGGKACGATVWPQVVPPGFDLACAEAGAVTTLGIEVRYTRPAIAEKRMARLEIAVEGDPERTDKPLIISFESGLGTPRLTCSGSSLVDFGTVAAGETAAPRKVVCTSTGSAAVEVHKIEVLTKGMPLAIEFAGQKAAPSAPWAGPPPVVIEPGKSLTFTATLATLTAEEKLSATMVIHSNDDSAPTKNVMFAANTTGPCLTLEPSHIDFGQVALGQTASRELRLEACGTEDTVVEDIAVEAGSAAGVDLDFSTSCFASAKAPTAKEPLVIAPNAVCSLFVTWSPPQAGSEAQGKVKVTSNAGPPKTVDLVGTSATASCPSACIAAKLKGGGALVDGGTVIPQSTIVFDSACSQPTAGQKVTTWKWSLLQKPKDSTAYFSPSPTAKLVELKTNMAGTYQVSLEIKDDLGMPGCSAAKFQVVVVPDDKLHIELTWDTPGDPLTDEGDAKGKGPDGKAAGSDLDLHLAHPLAQEAAGQKDGDGNGELDPWNAPCYDCFVLNRQPKWGDASDPDDDATLDLDDLDGWGPENVNLRYPEPGVLYQVGVYHWSDGGFGPSVPRVRIYLDGSQTPIFDKTGPQMAKGDMWCVQQVACLPTKLQPCKGANTQGNLLTHNYPLPASFDLACPAQ